MWGGGGGIVTLSISGDELTLKDDVALRQMTISSRLVLNPSSSLVTGKIVFLANSQIRPDDQLAGRVEEHNHEKKGMLLLCSPSLSGGDQNAIAIRFAGAELRRQERAGGSGCSEIPPKFD